MNINNRFMRALSRLLIATTLGMSIWLPGAQAAMISSEQVIDSQLAAQNRDKVRAFFDREDVQTQLQAQGVSADAAKARVDALTDNEVATVAEHIDNLPAGGDALGSVLGFALLIFIILLITDLLGLTHVFPFVKRR